MRSARRTLPRLPSRVSIKDIEWASRLQGVLSNLGAINVATSTSMDEPLRGFIRAAIGHQPTERPNQHIRAERRDRGTMPAGAERTATGLADERRAFVAMALKRVVRVEPDSQEAT